MKASDAIINIAQSYIGQQELKGNAGFKDEWFEKKMKDRGFEAGDAWCVLFCELVLYETYKDTPFEYYIDRLFSKSAVQTWNNFRKDGPFKCCKTAVPGAVVIWQKFVGGVGSWQGHAGIVIEVLKYSFYAVEGNGNSAGGREGIEVVYKERTYAVPDTGLRILGFIHPAQGYIETIYENENILA